MGAKTETAAPTAPATEPEAKTKETKEQARLRRFPVLTDTDAAGIAERARPASSPCLCGCGTMTKGRFAPGHDAILKERLVNTANHGTEAAQASAKAALATFGW